jgi:flagellar biosynthesis anti-sigma factor FlgM
MDIRSGLDGLKSLLGVAQPAPASTQEVKSNSTLVDSNSSLGADRATLSSAGSEVAQTAADGVVREDKVASIRAALSAGTYNVSASAVASRMVDALLSASN